jgi:hypothetical protein
MTILKILIVILEKIKTNNFRKNGKTGIEQNNTKTLFEGST